MRVAVFPFQTFLMHMLVFVNRPVLVPMLVSVFGVAVIMPHVSVSMNLFAVPMLVDVRLVVFVCRHRISLFSMFTLS